MAKNAQATGSIDLTEAEGNAQAIYTAGIGTFTKGVFEHAIKATQKAMGAVQKGEEDINALNSKIEEKRAGNATRLLYLARDCVAAVTVDGVADLKKAAELMEGACKYVEAITEIDFRRKNPEATAVKIRNIVPSWPVLRSDFINAMKKAGLDPNRFIAKGEKDGKEIPQPSAMRKAYTQWKEDPANASEVANTGRTPRTPTASTATHTPADEAGKVVATTNTLTDSSKSMLANIAVAMGQLDEKGQAEAVEILTKALAKIRNIAAKDDETKDAEAGVQTRRRPMPARVPESNQIAS